MNEEIKALKLGLIFVASVLALLLGVVLIAVSVKSEDKEKVEEERRARMEGLMREMEVRHREDSIRLVEAEAEASRWRASVDSSVMRVKRYEEQLKKSKRW